MILDNNQHLSTLRIDCLFNDISTSECVTSSNRMIHDLWSGKNVEISGHGLIEGIIPIFLWSDWGELRKL
jgi:hypothetical protein